jgi:hypothetical protein
MFKIRSRYPNRDIYVSELSKRSRGQGAWARFVGISFDRMEMEQDATLKTNEDIPI